MWCHLCKIKFTDHISFKRHILEIHRPELKKHTDSENSEQENVRFPISFDSDLLNEEGSDAESNEDVELSSDSYIEEHPSRSSSPSLEEPSPVSSPPLPAEPSPVSSPPSKYQKRGEPRRSTRIRKVTYKSRPYMSSGDSDEEVDDPKTNNSKSAVSNNELRVINPVNVQSVGQHFTINNNELRIINPVNGQAVGQQYIVNNNNELCVINGQAASQQQPVYVINPSSSNIQQVNVKKPVRSKQIFEWLKKHKELCKDLKYPLPPHFFNKLKYAHKNIISHYSMAADRGEESIAILRVYEDLNDMILKHITCVNDGL